MAKILDLQGSRDGKADMSSRMLQQASTDVSKISDRNLHSISLRNMTLSTSLPKICATSVRATPLKVNEFALDSLNSSRNQSIVMTEPIIKSKFLKEHVNEFVQSHRVSTAEQFNAIETEI